MGSQHSGHFQPYCSASSWWVLPRKWPTTKMGIWRSNPLQCSCLENPRDGEAWWAAVYGVAQSQTRLKQLSSSSSRGESESEGENCWGHSARYQTQLCIFTCHILNIWYTLFSCTEVSHIWLHVCPANCCIIKISKYCPWHEKVRLVLKFICVIARYFIIAFINERKWKVLDSKYIFNCCKFGDDCTTQPVYHLLMGTKLLVNGDLEEFQESSLKSW